MTEYVTIDELYYTIPAFNLYHHNDMVFKVVPYVEDDGGPTNTLENIVTFFSLKTWGNNYYGLRMASVISSLLIFMLLYIILKRILDRNTSISNCDKRKGFNITKNGILLIALVYLTTEFSFLVASRVAEPSIFRMLALVFIIYIGTLNAFRSKSISSIFCILLGFLSLSAVLYVYIYNAFIFFAVGSTVFLGAIKTGWKNTFRETCFFILGAGISLLSYDLFVSLVYQQSFQDIFLSLAPYKGRISGGGTGVLANPKHYIMNFVAIFSTNIFRFNIAILFLFLVSIPIMVFKTINKKDKFDILILNLLIFLAIQSIIINDYFLRKLVIILPLVMIVIITAFLNAEHFFSKITNSAVKEKLFSFYWMVGGCFFTLFIHLGSIIPKQLNTAIEINPHTIIPAVINRINLLVFIFVFLIVTMYYMGSKKVPQYILSIGILLVLIPGLYMDASYIYMHPKYDFRDTMIEMAEKVDNKVIAGGVGYGFRLYNNSIPVLNFYKYIYDNNTMDVYNTNQRRLFCEHIADYTLQFNNEPGFNENKYMQERGLVLEKKYNAVHVSLYKPKLE